MARFSALLVFFVTASIAVGTIANQTAIASESESAIDVINGQPALNQDGDADATQVVPSSSFTDFPPAVGPNPVANDIGSVTANDITMVPPTAAPNQVPDATNDVTFTTAPPTATPDKVPDATAVTAESQSGPTEDQLKALLHFIAAVVNGTVPLGCSKLLASVATVMKALAPFTATARCDPDTIRAAVAAIKNALAAANVGADASADDLNSLLAAIALIEDILVAGNVAGGDPDARVATVAVVDKALAAAKGDASVGFVPMPLLDNVAALLKALATANGGAGCDLQAVGDRVRAIMDTLAALNRDAVFVGMQRLIGGLIAIIGLITYSFGCKSNAVQ